jgi:hypothetical protein
MDGRLQIKNEMKYLLIFLLIVGCGTRKVESEKLESIEVNNTYSEGSKIVLGTNLTFTPFDNTRSFRVDGKEYKNVIVSNATTKIVKKWKIKIIYRTKTIYRTKIIEKTDHTILYTSMFFIACLFIFLWFKLKI